MMASGLLRKVLLGTEGGISNPQSPVHTDPITDYHDIPDERLVVCVVCI